MVTRIGHTGIFFWLDSHTDRSHGHFLWLDDWMVTRIGHTGIFARMVTWIGHTEIHRSRTFGHAVRDRQDSRVTARTTQKTRSARGRGRH